MRGKATRAGMWLTRGTKQQANGKANSDNKNPFTPPH